MTDKYIGINGSGELQEIVATVTSTGVAEAGKLVGLDPTGKLSTTIMPTGIGADTKSVTATEALAAGDFVNIYNSSGEKVRKADATTAGKKANGFVLAAVSNGGQAIVYLRGINNQVTGATVGEVFLSTTAGGFTSTAPSAAGNVFQPLGTAISATEIDFSNPVISIIRS